MWTSLNPGQQPLFEENQGLYCFDKKLDPSFLYKNFAFQDKSRINFLQISTSHEMSKNHLLHGY